MNSQTLVTHKEIQNWVSQRRGMPAIRRIPNSFGNMRSRLALAFPSRKVVTEAPSLDSGASPVSWTAWLAELDRQELALRVNDASADGYELVARRDLN
jgi:hypothetical protein